MNDQLNEALNCISDRHIAEAAAPRKKHRLWIPLTAAVLAASLLFGIFWWPGNPTQSPTDSTVALSARPWQPGTVTQLAAPSYPKMAPYPDSWDEETYNTWQASQQVQYNQPEGYADSLTEFFARSIPEFLSGEGNQVYSPVNLYMALAMLAETTGGQTQQEILDLLNADSIESLRTQAGHVWNAHYRSDGVVEMTMANSMWIDGDFAVNQATADTLARCYYASVYEGDLESSNATQALQDWLNEQTRGILKDSVEEMSFSPQTVFSLSSTMYFAAKWNYKFFEENNTEGTFYGMQGQHHAEFMNCSVMDTYYWGENFGAIQLSADRNSMWLILPDEGVSVQQVLESDEYLHMTMQPDQWQNRKSIMVHMSIPKFDVSQDADLAQGLKNMGVSGIFAQGANFSPLTHRDDLSINKIDHAARVSIDEEGVEAAALTSLNYVGAMAPTGEEVTFTLDRTFAFVISSPDQLPLFAGVVDQP